MGAGTKHDTDALPPEPVHGATPAEAFEQQWAADVVKQALEATERQLREDGKAAHWDFFYTRFVLVTTRPSARAAADIAKDIAPAGDPSNMARTAKSYFQRAYREVVRDTVGSASDLKDELKHLEQELAGSAKK